MAHNHRIAHPHGSMPLHLVHSRRLHWNLIWSVACASLLLSVLGAVLGFVAAVVFRLLADSVLPPMPLLNAVVLLVLVLSLPVLVFVLALLFVYNHAVERPVTHTLMMSCVLLALWIFLLVAARYYWGAGLELAAEWASI